MRSGLQIALLAPLCCLAVAALGAVPAEAGCGTVQRFAAERDAGPGRPPLAVGDSVLLGAAEEAAALGYDVDVRGCRQIDEGLALLRKRARAGKLPGLVVLALGSNSSVTGANVRSALRILGPDRTLGLVTPREVRGTPPTDAAALRASARRWPQRTALVDWAAYSSRRPKLTYSDGIHLTAAGQRALANLLRPPLDRLAGAQPPTEPPAGGGTAGGGATAP